MSKIALILLKLVVWSLAGLGFLFHKIWEISRIVFRPIKKIISQISWKIFSPFYRLALSIKRKLFGVYSPARNKFFNILTKKYSIHFLVILVVFFVFVGNINAQEIRRENIGENSIIFSLFTDQGAYEVEIVEERATINPQERILSYIDKSTQVTTNRTIYDMAQISEEQLAQELSTVTEGGAVVVKQNIVDANLPEGTATPRSGIIVHKVSDGETISAIATRYGVSVNTILWQNNLTARSVIRPGAELEILPVSGVVHLVKSGESLISISKKYGIDQGLINETNSLSDGDSLKIGQALIIPGGSKITTAVSRPQYASNTQVDLKKILTGSESRGSSTGTGKMLWPTSWRVITQYYSWRHHGLDIDGDYNSPIYAADDGVVTRAGWGTGYGNMYIVDHGNGIVTYYAHLSKLYAKLGDVVKRGDVLGMMGTTGWSTGTHLHFEVRVNGAQMNPLQYIQ